MSPAAAAVPALTLRNVTKRFGDVTALNGVDLTVEAGTVHALLGENGAGKTTLMRIAYGLTSADAGTVQVAGQAFRSYGVRDAVRARVGMVQQHHSLVPTLTAAENLVLGGHGRYRSAAASERLAEIAQASGLAVPSRVLARDLSIVEQQRLEIMKALARDATLLILDEPTAVLAPAEVDDLLRWIRGFAQRGGSVVLITHKLREALAVADRITVLRRGVVVHSGDARGASERDVAAAIFQEAVTDQIPATPMSAGESVATADRLEAIDPASGRGVRDASLRVHRHEIVGLAAVEGSGHRELLLLLAGLVSPRGGTLALPSRIAVIPADRGRDALIGDLTLTENVALRGASTRRGLMPWRALHQRTSALLASFGITASSASAAVRTLSGGNQQRLVVARELEDDVDLVVADNPTRGLDIRSTAFVHGQLRNAAARGAAVIVHSSDLDEVLSLATRVLVVFQGVVREVPRDRDAVGRAMLGAV